MLQRFAMGTTHRQEHRIVDTAWNEQQIAAEQLLMLAPKTVRPRKREKLIQLDDLLTGFRGDVHCHYFFARTQIHSVPRFQVL